MYTLASDKNFVSPEVKCQQIKNVLRLSDFSPIRETWEKHRANADKVSDYYEDAGEGYFKRYSWRVRMCSDSLSTRLLQPETIAG